MAENLNAVQQIIKHTQQCRIFTKIACLMLNFFYLATDSACLHVIHLLHKSNDGSDSIKTF